MTFWRENLFFPNTYLLDSWKSLVAIEGKITCDLPCCSPIQRLFNVHGSRSEWFECHDHMCDVELLSKIHLNGDILHTRLWLPPRTILILSWFSGRLVSVDDIFDPMRSTWIVTYSCWRRIAFETSSQGRRIGNGVGVSRIRIIVVGYDAVFFGSVFQSTRRSRR